MNDKHQPTTQANDLSFWNLLKCALAEDKSGSEKSRNAYISEPQSAIKRQISAMVKAKAMAPNSALLTLVAIKYRKISRRPTKLVFAIRKRNAATIKSS